MHIRSTSTDRIDRAMSIAEGIALGIAYVIVALSLGTAFAIFTVTNFIWF